MLSHNQRDHVSILNFHLTISIKGRIVNLLKLQFHCFEKYGISPLSFLLLLAVIFFFIYYRCIFPLWNVFQRVDEMSFSSVCSFFIAEPRWNLAQTCFRIFTLKMELVGKTNLSQQIIWRDYKFHLVSGKNLRLYQIFSNREILNLFFYRREA